MSYLVIVFSDWLSPAGAVAVGGPLAGAMAGYYWVGGKQRPNPP
jgi:hypothetical protein